MKGGITIHTAIISYAGLCLRGDHMPVNGDNLFLNGSVRSLETPDSPIFTGTVSSTSSPGFAVFDGSGRKLAMQHASLIAAECFGRWMKNDRPAEAYCREAGRSIRLYASEHHIGLMGTTVVALWTTPQGIEGMNIGSSRCYLSRNEEIFLLSRDHALCRPLSREPLLTRYLGMPETEYLVDPFLYRTTPQAGDRFLLSTDGLTRQLSTRELSYIMTQKKDPKVLIRELQEAVDRLSRPDDMTMIVISVDEIE